MSRISALHLRDTVLDPGSFTSWDSPPIAVPMSPEYAAELAAAQAKTGLDESVLTGEGTVFGRRVAVVACEFDFLAGSIGVAAGDSITAAIEREKQWKTWRRSWKDDLVASINPTWQDLAPGIGLTTAVLASAGRSRRSPG